MEKTLQFHYDCVPLTLTMAVFIQMQLSKQMKPKQKSADSFSEGSISTIAENFGKLMHMHAGSPFPLPSVPGTRLCSHIINSRE